MSGMHRGWMVLRTRNGRFRETVTWTMSRDLAGAALHVTALLVVGLDQPSAHGFGLCPTAHNSVFVIC